MRETQMRLDIARTQMITQQLRTWNVKDPRVLAVMAAVPREQFVPEAYRRLAFADTAVPIGEGRTMLPPKIQGRMLQGLNVQGGDRVLEVGTGTGFVTACLARLGGKVRSVEIRESFVDAARERLSTLGVEGVTVETGDAMSMDLGGPYDAIAVKGSLPSGLERFEALLDDGGRLFGFVGVPPVMQAWLVTRTNATHWQRDVLFETVVSPLENAPSGSAFAF